MSSLIFFTSEHKLVEYIFHLSKQHSVRQRQHIDLCSNKVKTNTKEKLTLGDLEQMEEEKVFYRN
jgi:hypothetical protein